MQRGREVLRRLARIEGHVYSIRKMLEEGRSYPEIVQQILAVRSSLDSAVQVIVEDLVDCCVSSADRGEDLKVRLKELKDVTQLIH